jgi:uncharacterized protein
MRIAAIGDLHCRQETPDLVRELLGEIEGQADVLVLTGDLTDTGLPAEADQLAGQLSQVQIPIVAILGNHDHESGQADVVAEVLRDAGVHMLDASVYELDSVGFVGAKGFAGGFGQYLIQPFGEQALKTFINTSIEEAVNLENALARLQHCHRRIAVLHYAPIKDTLQGEPQELWPFLGSSRLCEVLDRRKVDVIVHGHAHYGSPGGSTQGGIPVHNVCRFVQERHTGSPYCLVEL